MDLFQETALSQTLSRDRLDSGSSAWALYISQAQPSRQLPSRRLFYYSVSIVAARAGWTAGEVDYISRLLAVLHNGVL